MSLGEVDLFARRQFPEKNSAESCYLPTFQQLGKVKLQYRSGNLGNKPVSTTGIITKIARED